ncbi:glutamate receptor-interacting protein 2 isoform X1 [Onthophagus taurus]|uniref:glutamate receptor-interacting protein 2 isoform X1 n=1 Tax=Onthophagus taurus TaxID=166361 RepID=UPI0039BDFC78
MKLWKVLARNSHVYTNHITQSNGMELYEFKSRSPTFSEDSGKHSGNSLHETLHQNSYLATVQLRRKPGENLGIILSSGHSEIDQCPSIASLRPGSVALTSDQLVPGDKIHSINGINTSRMRPEDVTTLLDNVDGNALLEIEYSLPNFVSENSLCLTSKIAEISIERLEGSLGITLRGGTVLEQPHLSKPLVITQVRTNGPAYRSGLIKPGDRLLKVDSQPLINKTLIEAQKLLKEASQNNGPFTNLTIEYDVNIMESVKYATGPLLVEIDRQMNEDLGLILGNCCDLNSTEDILTAGIFISNIIPASVADRCGALNVGDQILAIDNITMEEFNGSSEDAESLLRDARKLQILPYHTFQRVPSRNYLSGQYPNSPSISGFSTINSRRSRNKGRFRQSSVPKSLEIDSGTNFLSYTPNLAVYHTETLTITLIGERGKGYGLFVSNTTNNDHGGGENRTGDIVINRIAPDTPAHRCGCLQTGDRIVSVNHQSNLTVQEINSILEMASDGSKIILQVGFDVADTIVPSSGVFTVKLVKRGGGLGITITASKHRPDEPFIISEIRRGSIAHRTGTLHAGDRLLAVDNRQLDRMSIETAFDILQTSANDIVTLKVEKTETDNSNLSLDSVVYTVELVRYGGPLGITISGSEDCSEPIVLSRLTEGGLAEKTGALHVGDRILAINGESLDLRPLSDAIRLLQSAGDRVQLKIARNLNQNDILTDDSRCTYSSPGLMSLDSAVHSWDSNQGEILDNDCINPVKDHESVISEPISTTSSTTHQQHQTDENNHHSSKPPSLHRNKHDSQLQFYSDAEETTFCPSPLPLPNYNFTNTLKYDTSIYRYHPEQQRLKGTFSNESILDNEVYHVTLYKDSVYDDYGFSVSDGLYEKGVYINRIRKGGPADIVGLLKPFDRIVQVNETKTVEFDCCLTVPLIASAGDRIELIVSRNPYVCCSSPERTFNDCLVGNGGFLGSQSTIVKSF